MTTEAEINAETIATVVQRLLGHLELGRIKDKDRNFVRSLCSCYTRRKFLSEGQAKWARKMLAQVELPRSAEAPSHGNFPTITAEFQRLFDAGKKAPKLLFRVEGARKDGTTFKTLGRISTGRGRSVLYVSVDGYGWIGTLRLDGTFLAARHVYTASNHYWNAVLGELAILNRDPHGYARRFAETGCCCYCGKGLEDPPSVEAGYGPQCAKTWGRPWGGKTAEERAKKRVRKSSNVAIKLDGDADSNFW